MPPVRAVALMVLLSALATAGCLSDLVEVDPVDTPVLAEPQVWNTTVEGQDDVSIALTVFQPAGASATSPVPMVLHSHGWAGTRATNLSGAVGTVVEAGYGVVSIDMRGHGQSQGQARVHSMDHEIVDVQRVIDHVATFDWVAKEAVGDPILGAMGGSYGGGYQLLTAAVDDRLDALVPEITWHNLPEALAPGGAVKSAWVHALYGAGKSQARLHPSIDEAYQEALATNEMPEEALERFQRSSPASYPSAIDVPTLLIQGVPDTLFNLNQAVGNLMQIQATGADARLLAHLDGHLLNPGSLTGQGQLKATPVPQPGEGGSPCADVDAARLAWFDEHLKGQVGAAGQLANVSLALADGHGCITSKAWPPVTTRETVETPGPVAVPQGPAAGGVSLPLTEASGPMILAGIPTLAATLTGGASSTLYASLLVQNASGLHVVDSQVIPVRVEGAAQAHEVDLAMGGVAIQLSEGDQLLLRLEGSNDQYLTNAERVPGGLVVEDLVVELPLREGPPGSA